MPAETGSLNSSVYQLEKYLKHTAPTSACIVNSIYDDPSWATYENYTVSAGASGWVEVDNQHRVNMVWYAGKNTGVTYKNGVYSMPTNCIKVVLIHDAFKIHSFPLHQPEVITALCLRCSKPIPYER